MILDEPTISYCYFFVLSVFFVSFVRIFTVRGHHKRKLHQLISERE
jgi:hypothetical protein